ncbi:MAG: KH domain-containing protein [Promethearchaeota archaeon]
MSLNKDRLAVAIGKDGSTKNRIEKLTGTKIFIDSVSGNYRVEENPELDPSDLSIKDDSPGLRIYMTQHILEAINYGFNPEKAMKLIDPELMLEVIDLEKIVGHSEKKLKRIKGRLIGDKGKIRNSFEQFSGVSFSIYKKFLALIGNFESIKIAKKGINMIIQGIPHKTVLAYLTRKYQEKKQEEFTKMWKPVI